MLDSIPVVLQVNLWLLLGAVVVVAGSRFLPNWLCRSLALLAVLTSLVQMWSLQIGPVEAAEIVWNPIGFFRLGPSLHPDGLSLLVGLVLAWFTAGTLLGVHGTEAPPSPGPGLILVALAGCLVMAMASNLLTVALGSALLDLALLAAAVTSPAPAGTTAWRISISGGICTLLLVLGALQMDTQVGTTSLQAQGATAGALGLLAAGIVRLTAFPLFTRGLRTPQHAILSVLSVGAGLYLLARSEAIRPLELLPAWMAFLAALFLVGGGVLSWTASLGKSTLRTQASQESTATDPGVQVADVWPAFAVHQAGLALAYLILVPGPVPWPLVAMVLCLGILIIWWDAASVRPSTPRPEWPQGLGGTLLQWIIRVRNALVARVLTANRWPVLQRAGKAIPILPGLALACFAGAPLTVGAIARWRFYTGVLQERQLAFLLVSMLADALLAAGLWATLVAIVARPGGPRLGLPAVTAMVWFVVPLILLWLAPGLVEKTRPQPFEGPRLVLGFVFVAPWLLGCLLVRSRATFGDRLRPKLRRISLRRLSRAAASTGQQVVAAVHWLGLVGEGEGWFGWALVILAFGAMLLALR